MISYERKMAFIFQYNELREQIMDLFSILD